MAKTKVKKKRSDAPQRWIVFTEELDTLPINEIYTELIEKLRVDVKRAGTSTVQQLIFDAPEDTRLAGYIYAVAKEERERIDDDYNTRMGEWITEARSHIAGLKKEKEWEGQTTQADVERIVFKTFTEAVQVKAVVRRARTIERAAKSLYEAFQSRLSALQTYARLDERRSISMTEYNMSQKKDEK